MFAEFIFGYMRTGWIRSLIIGLYGRLKYKMISTAILSSYVLTSDIIEYDTVPEEVPEDLVEVPSLLVLELLEIAREDAKHGALHTFLDNVVLWSRIELVFDGTEKFLDLHTHVLLSLLPRLITHGTLRSQLDLLFSL